MSKFLVLTKSEAVEIEVTSEDNTPVKLTTRIARRCALEAKAIPSWITDGNLVYRVTPNVIHLIDYGYLRQYLASQIDTWRQLNMLASLKENS